MEHINNIKNKIELYLGRNINDGEVVLRNDGEGDYIAAWNIADKPKPEINQLEVFRDKAVKTIELYNKILKAEMLIEKGRQTMGVSYEGWRQRLIGLKRKYIEEREGLLNE